MTAAPSNLDARREQELRERRAGRSVSQRASSLRRLTTVWLLGFAGLSVVALQERVPVEDLFLDASVVGGGHWYAGLVTSLGVVIWAVAATAAFGAGYISWLVRRMGACVAMTAGGSIITFLLLDDLFQLHSAVFPALTGLPKVGLVVVEGLAVAVWLSTCRRELLRTRWELLGAAGLGFVFSLLVDQVIDPVRAGALLIEDGSKLLGVLALAAWSVSTATDIAGSAIRANDNA